MFGSRGGSTAGPPSGSPGPKSGIPNAPWPLCSAPARSSTKDLIRSKIFQHRQSKRLWDPTFKDTLPIGIERIVIQRPSQGSFLQGFRHLTSLTLDLNSIFTKEVFHKYFWIVFFHHFFFWISFMFWQFFGFFQFYWIFQFDQFLNNLLIFLIGFILNY